MGFKKYWTTKSQYPKLDDKTAVDRSVVSIKIAKLVEKKLIKKNKPFDRRSDRLSITNNGKLLIESLIRDVESQENIMFEKLGSEIFNFTNSLKLLLGKKIRIKAKLNDWSRYN